MKKTKEINEKNEDEKKESQIEKTEIINNKIDEIMSIESLEDARKFEEVASGRKFCKKGERLQDICAEEVDNYICKTRKGLFARWQLRRRNKKKEAKLLIESRVTRVIRTVAIYYIEENDECDEEIVSKNVKKAVIERVRKYKENATNR